MFGVVMINDVNLPNLINIYEKEISKNIKNKKKLYNFEINKMQHMYQIMEKLLNGEVGHQKYNIFLIYEPKCRLVMSLSVEDKIINHFVTRYSLEKKLTKYLDMRNVATRKNMGTDYGIKLVIKYLNKLKNKYNKFYILKLDISKYFYSIDHLVLKSMLVDKLDNYEYNIVCKILDSTNKEYINKTIDKLIKCKNINIPRYEYNKGLPIGNMTSQFLSIYYLNELDHYIIHTLKLKHYVRYMDDFIIMDSSKEKLIDARNKIVDMLENVYKLKVNKSKTSIVSSNIGFSFLGYTYKIVDNKTIVKVKKSNIDKIKKRIKQVKYMFNKHFISHYRAFCSVMTYSNSYKFGNNRKILKVISKCWYEE